MDRRWLFYFALTAMALMACLKLSGEFFRLVADDAETAAVDLKMYYYGVGEWFSGDDPYVEDDVAVYPPASYLLLWPFHGWLSLQASRWFWAFTTLAAIFWMSALLVRETATFETSEKWFVVLMLLSMNATGVTIGNGQLGLHLLPAILTSLRLLFQKERTFQNEIVAALLLLCAFVKPNFSVPFICLLLLIPRKIWPAALLVATYAAITLLASWFHPDPLAMQFQKWFDRSALVAVRGGYADLHTWLAALNLQSLMVPASLIALAVLAFWVHRHRNADPWLLIGVVALFCRMWANHRTYDDVLVLLPMITLFLYSRSKTQHSWVNRTAAILLYTCIILMMVPARFLFYGSVLRLPIIVMRTALWVAMFIYLLVLVRRQNARMSLVQVRPSP